MTVPRISIGPFSGSADGVREAVVATRGGLPGCRAGAAGAGAGQVMRSAGSPISSARARNSIGRRTTEASLTVGPVRIGAAPRGRDRGDLGDGVHGVEGT